MFKNDLLLGQIAVESGLIDQGALQACVVQSQKENLPLGYALVSGGHLAPNELVDLLEQQNTRLRGKVPYAEAQREDILLGKLLLKRGALTALQVSRGLMAQIECAERGLAPPRLGEWLVDQRWVSRDLIHELLNLQTKKVSTCAKCGTRYNIAGYSDGKVYTCPRCQGRLSPAERGGVLGAETTVFGINVIRPDGGPRRISEEDLGRALVDRKLVHADDMQEAFRLRGDLALEGNPAPLDAILTEMELITPEALAAFEAGIGWRTIRCPDCRALYDVAHLVGGGDMRCNECGGPLRATDDPLILSVESPPESRVATVIRVEVPPKPPAAPPPRNVAPPEDSDPNLRTVSPPPIDPKAVEAVERLESIAAAASGMVDGEARERLVGESEGELLRLVRWANQSAAGTPLEGRILHLLGEFHELQGRGREAHKAFLGSFAVGHELAADRVFELGKFLIADRDRSTPAVRLYRSFVKELPFRLDRIPEDDRPRVYSFLLEICADSKHEDRREVRRLARDLADSHPRMAGAQHRYGQWLVRQKKWAEARDRLRTAQTHFKSVAPEARAERAAIHRLLGRCCRELGESGEAIEAFERSIEEDPLQIDAYLQLAELVLESVAPRTSDSITTVRLKSKLAKTERRLLRARENLEKVHRTMTQEARQKLATQIESLLQRVQTGLTMFR